MNTADLRQKSTEDLEKELVDLVKDQFTYRMQKSTGQLSQTHLLGQVRRDIARVKTVLGERNEQDDTRVGE